MYHQAIDTDTAEKLPLSKEAWRMFSFDNHEVIRLDLKPGESIENHTNDWRVIIYVLEGEGILNVEGTEHHLVSHQAMAVAPGIDRFLNNTSDVTLKLLVTKTRKTE